MPWRSDRSESLPASCRAGRRRRPTTCLLRGRRGASARRCSSPTPLHLLARRWHLAAGYYYLAAGGDHRIDGLADDEVVRDANGDGGAARVAVPTGFLVQLQVDRPGLAGVLDGVPVDQLERVLS